LPGGKNCGGEYVVRNPTRADHRRGSFKINLRSGRWSDFAAGDKGGDPISLAAYVEGVSPLERGADLRPFLERYGALAADFIKALGVGKVLPALHAIDGERP
jgi:hypothetical protein